MNAPTPNTAELVAIYQHIKANPQTWRQATFASRLRGECGTAFCVAGWAVVRAGGRPIDWQPYRDEAGEWAESWHAAMPDGREVCMDDEAIAILGLSGPQVGRLFSGANDLDDIRSVIHDITGVDPELAVTE